MKRIARYMFFVFLAMLQFPALTEAETVLLEWDPSSDSDLAGYKVYYQEDSSTIPFTGTGALEGPAPITLSTVTQATVSGLDPNKTYYFAVTAFNTADIESVYSNIVCIEPNQQTYTISTSASAGGTITPTTLVPGGNSSTFSVAPSTGYQIGDVLVDGTSVGAVTSYTFYDVRMNHSISAMFTPAQHTVSATLTGNGTLSCSPSTVNYGESSTCTFNLPAGYYVSTLTDNWIDKMSSLVGNTFTISNITENHYVEITTALPVYTITVNQSEGGTISPSGSVLVSYGGSQTFTITPNAGYRITDILINNISKGKPNNYSLLNITSDYSIRAAFSSSTPVYRFQNKQSSSQFLFTSSESEKNNIIANLSAYWMLNGVAFYAFNSQVSGSSPVYRFQNKQSSSAFLFTASESEKNNIIANLSAYWMLNGVAFYAFSN